MTKPALFRAAAESDATEALEHYFDVAPQLARAWAEALDAAVLHIQRFPATGSPRYAEPMGCAGLRFWLLDRFPYALFYVEREHDLDVLRVLHQHSDIPSLLAPSV